MNFFGKLRERHNVVALVVAISFIALFARMAKLTVVEGKEYREIANSRKFKEIPITAPRGEIRDRNGKLLASNKPSFTVQVIKDELKSTDNETRNKTLLKLTHILGDEGIVYKDEFPIDIKIFRYKEAETVDAKSPLEVLSERVVSNGLFSSVLNLNQSYSNNPAVKKFYLSKKALNILKTESEIPIPIDIDTENGASFYYTQEDVSEWLLENGLSQGTDAKTAAIKLIESKNVKQFTMKLLNDPISRALVYELLSQSNLTEDIELVEYGFSYDEEFISIKKSLSSKFESINMETSAKDDFVNILRETNGISRLLEEVFVEDSENDSENIRIPAEILIDILEEKQVDIPFKILMDKEKKQVVFQVKSEKKKAETYKKYKIPKETSAVNAIIKIAEQERVIEDFATHDEVKSLSQRVILSYVNPKISTSEWEYSPIADKRAWFKKYGMQESLNAEEAFSLIREKNGIADEATDFEARNMMIIIDEFNRLGYKGYYPVNVAYGANEKVVAQIEENKAELLGVRVSIEPIRHYPFSNAASHILGYMGRIAKQEEVEKYIKSEGYLPNYLIGKTGVEQTFESYLKGKDGSRKVEVDSLGNVVRFIEEREPVPGDTLYLTIDSDLQKVMEDSLEKAVENIQVGGSFESKWGNYNYSSAYRFATSASAVAIDPQTGEILAMANYPSYNPNLFATGISEEDWKSLMPEDENDPLAARPLYNTAMQTAVQPGSTFKMITGMAAMEVGIPPTQKIYDYGAVELGNSTFGCWIWNSRGGSHGPTDLYHALSESCNYYFYAASLGRIPKTGEKLPGTADVDEIMKVAAEFGLNEKTGIEINGEVARGVPSSKTKTETVKALLRNYLNSELEEFYFSEKKIGKEQKSKIISEITSWADYKDPLTKAEVVRKLAALGIDGEKVSERSGQDLGDTIKYTYLNQSQWNDADNMNISIGQGENSYTPLQMANYIATIANGGIRNKVSVVDRVDDYSNSQTKFASTKKSEPVSLNDKSSIGEVSKGMNQGASVGLVRGMFGNFPVAVAAKTGTAQRGGINPATGGNYDNYSWFTAFAPYEENNPKAAKIAVAVMISQGGEGGYSAPIGREIIAEYLKLDK